MGIEQSNVLQTFTINIRKDIYARLVLKS